MLGWFGGTRTLRCSPFALFVTTEIVVASGRQTPSCGHPHQVDWVPENDSHQYPGVVSDVGMQGELFPTVVKSWQRAQHASVGSLPTGHRYRYFFCLRRPPRPRGLVSSREVMGCVLERSHMACASQPITSCVVSFRCCEIYVMRW